MLIRLNEIINFLFKRIKSTRVVKDDYNNDQEEVKQLCSNILLARKLILLVPIAYIIAIICYIVIDTETFIEVSKYLFFNIGYVLLIAVSILGGSLLVLFISLTILINKEKREIIKNLLIYIPILTLIFLLINIYCSRSQIGNYILIAIISITLFYIIMNLISNIHTIKYSKLLNEDLKVLTKSKDTFITLLVVAIVLLIVFAPFWLMLLFNLILR